jgi:hypothetical protein
LHSAFAVVPLTIAVIELSLGTLLVPAIGAAPLLATGGFAARQTATAVSAIAMRADKEHYATVGARTKPLPENHFAMGRHVLAQAGLDNGNGFVAPLTQLVV